MTQREECFLRCESQKPCVIEEMLEEGSLKGEEKKFGEPGLSA